MAIIKRALRENFEVVLRSTMQDKSISLDTKGLLFFMLSLPSNWEIHVWWLKKEFCIGNDKTKRMLKELVTSRYIVRRRVNIGGGRFNWEMEVHPDPQATIVGLPIDGSTTDGSAIDGQPHDKDNREFLHNTESDNKQPQPLQPVAEAAVVGNGGNLIFDKAINQNLHQKLTIALANVELTIAQQMLDTLAAMGDNAKFPLKLIESFVVKQSQFDPSPGLKIAAARNNKKASEVAYQAASLLKADPIAAARGEAIIQKARKMR